MPVRVFRCSYCGREVLVRVAGRMNDAEIARRIAEEMRPDAPGPPGAPHATFRWRDDIWTAISGMRGYVPRDAIPDDCPACHRAGTLLDHRPLEE